MQKKKKKSKGWNCSDLYLIYFQALSAERQAVGEQHSVLLHLG